jgi:Trk-type K+ transport system membrane component
MPRPRNRGYFVRQQLRAQIAHDIWILVLAVLFITITETGQFERDPVDYSVFNIIFEVISGYGSVGISVGLPNASLQLLRRMAHPQ